MARTLDVLILFLLCAFTACATNPPDLVPTNQKNWELRSSNITDSEVLIQVPPFISYPRFITFYKNLPDTMKLCIEVPGEKDILCRITLGEIRRLHADVLRKERVHQQDDLVQHRVVHRRVIGNHRNH